MSLTLLFKPGASEGERPRLVYPTIQPLRASLDAASGASPVLDQTDRARGTDPKLSQRGWDDSAANAQRSSLVSLLPRLGGKSTLTVKLQEAKAMKSLFRWVALGALAIVCLLFVGYAIVYAVSEYEMRRTYPVPTTSIVLPTDSAAIAEGGRLSRIHGCLGGCHGRHGEGEVLLDDPLIAKIVGPNLTESVRQYTDSELVLIVRHGMRPDGKSMVVMPSRSFAVLSDEDLGKLLAYLKTLPSLPGNGPLVEVGPLGRIGLIAGQFSSSVDAISKAVPPPPANTAQAERGRYLARTSCTQCHGANLGGEAHPEGFAPDLAVVAAYSPEAFSELMRTGVGQGGRKLLPVMRAWAQDCLSQFTQAEVEAVYSYLHTKPVAMVH